jgi:hypothetical protein
MADGAAPTAATTAPALPPPGPQAGAGAAAAAAGQPPGSGRSPRLALPGAGALGAVSLAAMAAGDRTLLAAGAAAAVDVELARRDRLAALAAETEEVEDELARDGLQGALDRVAEEEADAVAAVWARLRSEVRDYAPLRWWQRGWYAFLLGPTHSALVEAHTAGLRRAYVEGKQAAARIAAARAFNAMRRVVTNWRRAGMRLVFRAWAGHAHEAAAKRRLGRL